MVCYKNPKEGFTLIELLAVIVVLAVIALIATPIIMNVISDAKKGAFKTTANGIVSAGENYAMKTLTPDSSSNEDEIIYLPNHSKLDYKGEDPTAGYMRILNADSISIAINNGVYCAKKEVNEDEVTVEKYDPDTCKVEVQKTNLAQHILSLNTPNNYNKLGTDPYGNTRFFGEPGEVEDEKRYHPKNYVKFDDKLWMILGVFDGQIKLVTADTPIMRAWDTENINDWATSSMAEYLNTTYYNEFGEAAKTLIDDHTYPLGMTNSETLDPVNVYNQEQGTAVFTGCTIGTRGCPRSTRWTGKVGIMYLSDVLFASCVNILEDKSRCPVGSYRNYIDNNGNRTLLINADLTTSEIVWNTMQKRSTYTYASMSWGNARPTVFLKQSASFSLGDGTKTHPYEIAY